MAESKRPNCRTKGAVLIMVLTIMFVLIIMLVATLSVVSTAKRRTYTSFEETQANLTARSAVEFFVTEISSNTAHTTGHDDPYFNVSATVVDMTDAREIEVDIRKLLVKEDTNKSMVNLTTVKADSLLTAMGLDPTKYSYNDNDTNGLLGEDKTNKITGTSTPYTDDKLVYTVTLPKAENSTYKYGKFADSNQATITVEVIDRAFHKGSSGDVKDGNRKLDIMKLRVTATAYFDDYEATTVLIVDTDTPPVTATNDFTRGIVATGSITANTKIRPFGGMASNEGIDTTAPIDPSGFNTYTMENNGVADSVYCSGNLLIKSSGSIDLGTDCYIAAVGNIYYNNSISTTSKSNKSFIYCGGKFTKTVGGNIGDSGMPLDLICNGATFDGGGTVTGNIYCDGNLTLNSVTIVGNIFVDGDFDPGVAKIVGNVYVNGKIYLDGNKRKLNGTVYDYQRGSGTDGDKIFGDLYCNPLNIFDKTTLSPINGTNATNYSKTLDLKYFYSGAFPVLHGSSVYSDSTLTSRKVLDATSRMIEYTLPKDSTTTKTYNIPSFESQYPSYMKVSEVTNGVTTGYKYDQTIGAFDKYNADVGTTASSLGATFTSNANATTTAINGDGILPGNTYNATLTAGSKLVLTNGATYQGKIVVDDDSTPTIFIVPEGATVTLKLQLLSKELDSIINGTQKDSTIYAGEVANALKKCAQPNIYIYVGDGANIIIDDSGANVGATINAYIYGPDADLTLKKVGQYKVIYNNIVPSPSNPAIGIVGAAIFNDVSSTDEAGIVFIKPNSGSSTPLPLPDGKPFVTWKVSRYTNETT